MKAIMMHADGSLKLPKAVLHTLPPGPNELAVWTDGDTIILKRLTPLAPSHLAKRLPEEEMPLAEITAEVHRMRREKRNRRG